MLKVALFDLDGTLQDIDTPFHEAVLRVFGRACREAGTRVSHLEDCLHAAWPDLWESFLAGRLAADMLRVEWFRRALPAAGISLDDQRLMPLADRYHETFEAGLRLFPDVMPTLGVLREARPKLLFGLVTNGPSSAQRRRASTLGLSEWFDIVVVSEEVGSAKPEERIFEVALAHADALPAEAVMVGDDPRNDVAGARAVGLHAIWVNRSGTGWPSELPGDPDGVVSELGGIVRLIRDAEW